jgi:hypothetical protein
MSAPAFAPPGNRKNNASREVVTKPVPVVTKGRVESELLNELLFRALEALESQPRQQRQFHHWSKLELQRWIEKVAIDGTPEAKLDMKTRRIAVRVVANRMLGRINDDSKVCLVMGNHIYVRLTEHGRRWLEGRRSSRRAAA